MHEIHQKRESPVRCTERVDYNENQHREFWGERTGHCVLSKSLFVAGRLWWCYRRTFQGRQHVSSTFLR